jgi:hypothetical protein
MLYVVLTANDFLLVLKNRSTLFKVVFTDVHMWFYSYHFGRWLIHLQRVCPFAPRNIVAFLLSFPPVLSLPTTYMMLCIGPLRHY